jgi:DNA-binding CsgD family transcriptional regulator
MNDILLSVIIFLSLGSTLAAILITSRLYTTYKLPYLSTYLYYQIFFGIFGIYGILVPIISRMILLNQSTSLHSIETIGHFLSILGLPILIIGWYMFLRLCGEMTGNQISRIFSLCYFAILSLWFLVYGAFLFLIYKFEIGNYQTLTKIFLYPYLILQTVVLITGVSRLFINSGKIENSNQRYSVIVFGSINLVIYLTLVILYYETQYLPKLVPIFFLVFFGANLPPVLYWLIYLRKHYIPPPIVKDLNEAMKQFSEKYEISRREEEIIQQICEGKSNKEIGEALFISLQTVKDHIYNIFIKTGVKNRVQLTNLIRILENQVKSTDETQNFQ